MKKNKDRKAAKVLAKIHQTSEEEVQSEIKDIQSTVVETEKKQFRHVLRLLITRECIQRLVSLITVDTTSCCTCSPAQELNHRNLYFY